MVQLASDVDNQQFVGARNPDDMLWVKFESRKYENVYKSELEGHPVYEMRDFVTIQAPGDQLTVIDTFVTEAHKRRFPRQWAHFLNTKDNEAPQGWLLESWPPINAAQVEELRYRKFRTVEQLAEAPLNLIQSLGMGFVELQNKAKIALNMSKDSASATKLEAELRHRDEQIAALQDQMKVLLASKEEKRGPGRPKVEAQAA